MPSLPLETWYSPRLRQSLFPHPLCCLPTFTHTQLHTHHKQASPPHTQPNESPGIIHAHSFLHSNQDMLSTYCASGTVLGAGAVKKKNKPWSLPLRSSQSSGRDKYKQLLNSVMRAVVDTIASSRKGRRLNL